MSPQKLSLKQTLKKNSRSDLALALYFLLVLLFLYAPLFVLVFQAFLKNPLSIREGFTFSWVKLLFQKGSLWVPLLNSLRIGILSATLSTLLGTLGAIGYQKIRSLHYLQSLIVLPMVIPEVITGLSLLLFFLFLRIPLGMLTMVLAHASFSASFVFFIILEQLKKLDPQLGEAAQDLGATPSQVFWWVLVPNISPGIISGFLLAFTISFDDFLISFFTSGASVVTLPLKIYSMIRTGISPELNALSFVMITLSTGAIVLTLLKNKDHAWKLKNAR